MLKIFLFLGCALLLIQIVDASHCSNLTEPECFTAKSCVFDFSFDECITQEEYEQSIEVAYYRLLQSSSQSSACAEESYDESRTNQTSKYPSLIKPLDSNIIGSLFFTAIVMGVGILMF